MVEGVVCFGEDLDLNGVGDQDVEYCCDDLEMVVLVYVCEQVVQVYEGFVVNEYYGGYNQGIDKSDVEQVNMCFCC